MSQKEIVLQLIKQKKRTALELSLIVRFNIANVHRRINDLFNDGLIRQTGEVIVTTDNITYAVYELTPFCEIQKTIIKRKNQLNINWILQGYSKKFISKDKRDLMLYELTSKINGNN